MKELTTEQRLLLALVLSIVVVTLSDLLVFRHAKNAPQNQTHSTMPTAQKQAAPPPTPAAGCLLPDSRTHPRAFTSARSSP